jgi:hypothetical protein
MTLRFRMMTLACLAAGGAVAADGFSRYDVILERKPFGEEVVPAPVVLTIPPGESVVNKVKMTAVVRDEAGVLRVGVVDLKSNRNYLLGIGDSLGDMEVVEADYERERARLRRGPEDYWVSMSGGSNRFEAATGRGPAGAAGEKPRTNAPPVRASRSTRKGDLDQRLSYALRRLQRDAARRRAEEPEAASGGPAEGRGTNAVAGVMRRPRLPGSGTAAGGDAEVQRVMQALTTQEELTPEEVAQLLQEYQKTLIRSGQTPLAIPLTPETDAQLVEEGYLPAP